MTYDRQPILGHTDAKFTIIEFSDYQCPYCGIADPILVKFVARHPNDSAIYRYDLPLQQIHHYAYTASVAANCAEQQGIGETYQSLLFKHQNDFSSLDWAALASIAGISNLSKFDQCIKGDEPHDKILRDIKISNQYGIDSTPAYVINGTLYTQGISEKKLESLLKDTVNRRYLFRSFFK